MELIFLLGLLLLPAIIIAFAVPTRYFGFVTTWVAMLALTGAAKPALGPDHSSPFSGTGDAIYIILCLGVAVIFTVRWLSIVARRGTRDEASEPASVAWAVTGGLAAVCAITTICFLSSAMKPPGVAHVPAVAIGLVALGLLVASVRRAHPPMRAFALGATVSAAMTLVIAGTWIVSRIDAVVSAAEAVAGEQPYCIQVVAVHSEFEPAKARIDFSPLTMRASCSGGFCWQNHAVLIVGVGPDRRLMNWSHRKLEFRDEVLNTKSRPPAVRCEPHPHFASDLPWS